MPSCSVNWCGSSTTKCNYSKDEISFHRFPNDDKIKEAWIIATHKKNFFPNKHSVICSRHFSSDCYIAQPKRRRLLSSAVPTLYLPIVSSSASLGASSTDEPQNELQTHISSIMEPPLQLSKKGQGRGEVFGCNECNENIQDSDGRMYKCLQCPNLLMCAACEDSDAHHKHSVVRFPSRRIYDKVKDLFALLQSQFEERLAICSKSDADEDKKSELDDDDDLNSDDNDKDEEKIIKQFTEESSILVKPSWSHNDDSGALETFFEVPVTSTEPETHTDPLEPQHNTHIDIKHNPKKRKGTEEPLYNKTSEPKRLTTEAFKEIVIKEEPPEDGMDLGQLPDTVIKLEAPDCFEEETLDQSQCTIYGSHTSAVKTENT